MQGINKGSFLYHSGPFQTDKQSGHPKLNYYNYLDPIQWRAGSTLRLTESKGALKPWSPGVSTLVQIISQ